MTTDNNDSPVTKKTPGKPSAKKLAEARERRRQANYEDRELYAQQLMKFFSAGTEKEVPSYNEPEAPCECPECNLPFEPWYCELFEGETPDSYEDTE